VKLSKKLEENLRIFKERLGIGETFDALSREFKVAGKNASLIYIDGFIKDVITSRLLASLMKVERQEIVPNVIQKLLDGTIDYFEIDKADTVEEVISQVLAGPLALLIDGEETAIILDVREYPGRQPQEPDIERVSRGSRDGFVETVVFNTTLIRRRLRDPNLRFEMIKVGKRSQSDVAVCYIKDIADENLINTIKNRLKNIEVDGIPMAEKSVEEFIVDKKLWWNPFPTVRYTERPDVAAVHLLEGHVLVMVDTSPSVMILPVTLFHHLEHAEEYREDMAVGVYFRLVRFLGVLISFFLPPLWILFALYPEFLPSNLAFIGPQDPGNVPILLQFILGELGIDMIRMAGIHTPSPLATSLGLIGAVLLGDFAVRVGLFAPETILYIALAAIGTFMTPSIEFAYAVRIWRIMMIILTGIFGIWGLLGGLLISFIIIATTKSFNVPYLWPLIPLNLRALYTVLIRQPAPVKTRRPEFLNPKDPDSAPDFRKKRRGR
jgi:stage V sporulation protein AF